MNRDLIIVRTYKADAASLAAYDLYAGASGFDVVFCVDERAAVADMGARDKVVFDRARLQALGLYPHPDCGWQCGDYFYHVARTDRPGYRHYWLIEPDVKINVANLGDFFSLFADNNADLLAPRLTYNDHTWSWTRQIVATGLPPWRCFYPVTRLSGRAIDHVFETRRRHALDPAIANDKDWPNDEGITASALAEAGFVCRDLNGDGITCHTGESLNGVALIDPDVLAAQPPDGLIYHPVRSFSAWFAEARASVVEIERDPAPEILFGRIVGRALHLTRIAQTCLRHPDYVDASLMPLALAAHLWSIRPEAPPNSHNDSDFMRNFHERAARLNQARLKDHFGVGRHRRDSGTAQVVTIRPAAGDDTPASPDDFTLGAPITLGRFPHTAALPYAWDLATGDLLLTAHLSVEPVLAEPCLKQAQRSMARIIVRAPAAKLAKVYPPTPAVSGLRFYLAHETGHAAHTADALRQTGIAVVSQPGALAQLAEAQPLLGDTIRPAAYFDMIRHTVAAFLLVRCASFAADQRTIVLPPMPARFIVALARVFPAAQYVVSRPNGRPLPPALANALSRVEVEIIQEQPEKAALVS